VKAGEVSQALPVRKLKDGSDVPMVNLVATGGATSSSSVNASEATDSESLVIWSENSSVEIGVSSKDIPEPEAGSVSVGWARSDAKDDNDQQLVEVGVDGKCVTLGDFYSETDEELVKPFSGATKVALFAAGDCGGAPVSDSVTLPDEGRVVLYAYNLGEESYGLSVIVL
jgi:hypothetical protein